MEPRRWWGLAPAPATASSQELAIALRLAWAMVQAQEPAVALGELRVLTLGRRVQDWPQETAGQDCGCIQSTPSRGDRD